MSNAQTGNGVGLSIGKYVIQRLHECGIRDMFGIPGDYILSFYTQLEQSDINIIGCTREDCAGFAADAYARINGIGGVCVTYCVGGLSVCNSIAGAYAEKSPVVVISGSPGLRERMISPLLHHVVRDFRTQLDVFEKLCVAVAELSDPVTAFREVDRVLDICMRVKRPVYIEIPRDMVDVVPQIGHSYYKPASTSDPSVLAEAIEEAKTLIQRSKRPVILAGVEMHRFGLQDQLLAFAEATQIPVATTLLGKSVISETHPLFAGLYEGALCHDEVRRFVEDSDCLILLGTFMTDINLGIFTANLDPGKCIYATSEQLRIRHHHYHDVRLDEFIKGLQNAGVRKTAYGLPSNLKPDQEPFHIQPSAPVTISRLIRRLNDQLDENTTVIADIGDALFGATDLVIHGRTEFISPAYYTSMGFSVPAALGAQVASPDTRVIVICGDGAFQMTGQELSTIVRLGYSPVVIILNNRGYGTERRLHEGEWKFNDIQPWNYHELPRVYGGGKGYEIRTEGEFDQALNSAWLDRSGPSILHVHIDVNDHSRAMQRLGERLGARVQMKP
jgi:indolepyruvate decarboxylase